MRLCGAGRRAFDWSATRRLQENATFAHRVAPPKKAAHIDRCQRMMVNPERVTTIDVSIGFVELKPGSGMPIPQVPEDTGNSGQPFPRTEVRGFCLPSLRDSRERASSINVNEECVSFQPERRREVSDDCRCSGRGPTPWDSVLQTQFGH